MKSFHLVVSLAIASLSVSCGADQTASLDSNGQPKEPVLAAHTQVDGAPMISSPSSVAEKDALASNKVSFVSRGTPTPQNVTAKPTRLVTTSKPSRSTARLATALQGRDNPFALAEQPEFEVRFLAAKAPVAVQPLPPVPSIGLGPESGGASLTPLVAAPAGTPLPVMPSTGIQQTTVAPVTTPLPALSTNDLPVVAPVAAEVPVPVSPTALAEAVEIKGIVQLGDYNAVIVKDFEGALSRTVQPGARLAGGQVELRRIETTTAEPQVVLMQNGIEIVRGVGV